MMNDENNVIDTPFPESSENRVLTKHAIYDIKKQTELAIGGGMAVGLIGYPGSGKTSYLYSLQHGATSHASGQRKWCLKSWTSEGKGLTGRAGEQQPATKPNHFKIARICEVRRPSIPWVGQWPRKWKEGIGGRWKSLSIPEVAGELTKKIAEGQHGLDYQEVSEKYLQFLGRCDSILFLIGIDNIQTKNDLINPDLAISNAINGFQSIITKALSYRKDKHDIAVSILITKMDILKQHPSINRIILSSAKSQVYKLSLQRKYSWIQPHLLLSEPPDNKVQFEVNELASLNQAKGKLDFQQAIAADFLNCHAPTAAKLLGTFCNEPRVNVRFFLSKAYGADFKSAGVNIFPEITNIRSFMVYEPLEDALERSWTLRSNKRINRRLRSFLYLGIILLLVGPLLLGFLENSFHDSINQQMSLETITSNFTKIKLHPLFHLEQYFSQAKRVEQSQRLIELRQVLVQHSTPNDPEIIKIEDQAYALDPNAVVADISSVKYLRDIINKRGELLLVDYLKGTSQTAFSCNLTSAGVHSICDFLEKITKGNPPAGSDWLGFVARIMKVQKALFASPSDTFQIVCSDQRSALEHSLNRAVEKAKAINPTSFSNRTIDAAIFSGQILEAYELDDVANTQDRKVFKQAYSSPPDLLTGPIWVATPNGLSEDLAQQERLRAMDAWFATRQSIINAPTVGLSSNSTLEQLATALRECNSILQPVRQALFLALKFNRGTSQHDLVAGMESAIPLFNKLEQRDNIISTIQNRNISDLTAPSFRQDLLNSFPETFQSKVAWQKLSENCKDVQIDLTPLADIQKRIAIQLLTLRTEEQMKLGELKNAKICLDLRRDLGESGRTIVVDQSVLELIILIQKDPTDSKDFNNSIHLLVSSQDGLKKYCDICTRPLLGSKSVEKLLPIATTALAATMATNCDEIKQAWSKEIIEDLPSSQWSLMTSSELVSILNSFNQMGLSPTEALPKMLDDIQDQVINQNILDAQASNYKNKVKALWKASRKLDNNLDLGPISLSRLVIQLKLWFFENKNREQLNADLKGLRVLNFLSGVAVDSTSLKIIVDACIKHRDLIDKWNLLMVTPKQGARFWLSKTEWTWKDIERLPYFDHKRLVSLPNECDSSLHINYLGAKRLVDSVGLRLPTSEEFNAAWFNLDQSKIKLHPTASDLKITAALEKIGDISNEGIVGLEYGVSEWVSNGELKGHSNSFRDKTDLVSTDAILPKRYDLGFRPALDLFPKELQNFK